MAYSSRGAFQEIRTYDGLDRLLEVRAKDTSTGVEVLQTYAYDGAGRRTSVYNPNSTTLRTQTSYDILGRVKAVIHPDGNQVVSSYIPNNQVIVQDERGVNDRYVYRSYGDPEQEALIRVFSAEGRAEAVTTFIDRNKLGLIEHVAQGGLTRDYGYDTRYYLRSEVNPETGTTFYGRNNLGNMTVKSPLPPLLFLSTTG